MGLFTRIFPVTIAIAIPASILAFNSDPHIFIGRTSSRLSHSGVLFYENKGRQRKGRVAGRGKGGRIRDNDSSSYRSDTRNGNRKKNLDDKDFSYNEQDSRKLETPSHFFSKKPLTHPTFSNEASEDTELFKKLCQGSGISQPSRIQALAWPVLLKGEAAIVADQTGSGKTLGYLIPLLQRMLTNSFAGADNVSTEDGSRCKGAPKLLIMAPTTELADQINQVCSLIAESVPFKTMVISSTGKHSAIIRDQIRYIQSNVVDVLISTPGRLATILRSRNSGLDLRNLQSIVLDEVDVLMIDETFGPQLRTVGAAAPVGQTQFVFVTATLPDTVVDSIQKEFPNVRKITGPGLHRIAPTIKEHLVDVSVPSDYNQDPNFCFEVKAKELMKALRNNRCKRTLVFCNTVDSCRNVVNVIGRSDRQGKFLKVGAYHSAMKNDAREHDMDTFSFGTSDKTATDKGKNKKANREFENDLNHVLVCTDRAARGVDFHAAPVDHVIIFDFPKDPAEYIRRVGRTARAGRSGTSTVLAYGWQLPVARKIIGSKLDSSAILATVDSDGNEDYSSKQRFGTPVKEQRKIIEGNIAGGRMWN